MKADRLLSVLLLLQGHGRLSTRTLAGRLEVSSRTVHRDMEALSAAGVPVFALRGARGGWQLDDQWRTQVPGLDEAELRALLMAQPRAIGDPRLMATAERALAKLLAALPEPLREQAVSIRQRLYVDGTGWYGSADDLSALPIVQEAVSRDRVLAIEYRPPGGGRDHRVVHPLGLVATRATWYLVARTERGLRTYRVSRIEHATMREERFERPPDFDLAAHWTAATEAFRHQRRFSTVLRLEARAAHRLTTWCRATPADPAAAPDAEGPVMLRVEFTDEDEAHFVVLGLGSGAEVVEPASLRERVALEIMAMARRVDTRPRGPQRDDDMRSSERAAASGAPPPHRVGSRVRQGHVRTRVRGSHRGQ